jgi:hypothetical protein
MNRSIAALALFTLVGCSPGFLVATPGEPTPTPGATPTPTPSPPPTISAECAELLQPLLDALEDLDARLNVGLNKSQYSDRVGDVSVAYSRLDASKLSALGTDCISTGATLEDAFNEYISANNEWSECLSDRDCSNDDVRPTLQRHWATATEEIDEVREQFP